MTHADGTPRSTGNAFDIPVSKPKPKYGSPKARKAENKLLDTRGYRASSLARRELFTPVPHPFNEPDQR